MNTPSSASWDQGATKYDAHRTSDPVYMSCARVTSKLAGRQDLVLDAGCGTGLVSAFLRKRASRVVGLDYSLNSLLTMNAKGIPAINAVAGSIDRLPFEDGAFDAVVCSNTLQHFKQGQHLLIIEELKRVLKPGGILVISVHHYSLAKRRAGWIKEGKPGQPGVDYIHRFEKGELEDLLPGCTVHGVGYYGLLKLPLLGALQQDAAAALLGRLLARLAVGHMLIAVARKAEA